VIFDPFAEKRWVGGSKMFNEAPRIPVGGISVSLQQAAGYSGEGK